MTRKTDAQIYDKLAELAREYKDAFDERDTDSCAAISGQMNSLHWVLSPGEPEPAKRGRPKGSRTRNRKPAAPIAEAVKEKNDAAAQ